MGGMYQVSTSPHVNSKTSTRNIMLDVAIALIPAAGFGVYQFGARAALIILVSIFASVMTEYVYQSLMGLRITITDGSALVTGLLLALNLSVEVPLWIPFIGGVFAILVVKQLFGGIGQNFMNPALAARCFLLISFAGRMTTYSVDGVTGPTPLAVLKEGGTVDMVSMFFGTIGGCIGETSVVAILAGAAYLLIKQVIHLRIPLTYIISFSIFILLFGGHGFDFEFLLKHLFGGGLMLGAFFMATDYATSPITPLGQIVFGILLGLLTGIFRILGGSAEGVSYAIIISNLLVPLIERFTYPKAFGKENPANGK